MQSLKKRVVVEVRLSMEGHFDEAGRHDTHGVIIVVKLTYCWACCGALGHLMIRAGRRAPRGSSCTVQQRTMEGTRARFALSQELHWR